LRNPTDNPREVFGVDFSGAADAGKKIWVANGSSKGERLLIKDCRRADSLPASGKDRDRCLTALRDFIKSRSNAAFGLDFPFGLPGHFIADRSWEDFVASFPRRYEDPKRFRDTCSSAADGRELKRVTDSEAKTPFASYNLRLYRQTYYGISKILSPLVSDSLACVLPMQSRVDGKPWLLEVCPASTLKARNLYFPYKGRTAEHRQARTRIVGEIEKMGLVHGLDPVIRKLVVEDKGGDALDSVIAALATFHAVRHGGPVLAQYKDFYKIEGYVYV
jgi:hypothetical protein